ncbi:MAG: glycosyltransferase family 39 protein [Betaproteobacteria bacterium]
MAPIVRYIVPAAFIAVFLALATFALDKPGYYYDEVIFVPASLRLLGDCDVDATVTRQWGCLPLMQTFGYVGAVKAWVHAPMLALFGTSVWTVRLPSILFGAASLFVLWSFARRELGVLWAAVLLVVLATDPVLIGHARLDWGPHMIATFLRVVSLVTLWRWLQTGRTHWLLITCAAFLIGFIDKLNFVWVIAAWVGAAALVTGHLAKSRLQSGRPWQPAIVALTAALLLWGSFTLVRRALQLDIGGEGATVTVFQHVTKVWNLYASTFSGTSVLNWVFGTDVPVTSAFNVLAMIQFAGAIVLLVVSRPWMPAKRLLAFLTVAWALLAIAIMATVQVGGTHHLISIWPLPTLHLVTLFAIAAQHLEGPTLSSGRRLRAVIATAGTVIVGALLAWNAAVNIRMIDAWQNDRDFTPPFDPAIAKLASRLNQLKVERVIAVDWGLHQQLVTLADRTRAASYREWTWQLADARGNMEYPDLRRAVAAHVEGKRVAFVLHAPGQSVFPAARVQLDALLQHDKPCSQHEEMVAGATGTPLYTIVIADWRDCTGATRPRR